MVSGDTKTERSSLPRYIELGRYPGFPTPGSGNVFFSHAAQRKGAQMKCNRVSPGCTQGGEDSAREVTASRGTEPTP